MSARHRTRSERGQLELFRAPPRKLAPRDAQDLVAYPFFSLAMNHALPKQQRSTRADMPRACLECESPDGGTPS
jgi:plasmid replication initiation protein